MVKGYSVSIEFSFLTMVSYLFGFPHSLRELLSFAQLRATNTCTACTDEALFDVSRDTNQAKKFIFMNCSY